MLLGRARVVGGALLLALAGALALPAQAQRRAVIVEDESTTSGPPPQDPRLGVYQGQTADGQPLAIELGSAGRSSIFRSAVRGAVPDARGDWHADGERVEIAIGGARHVLRFSPALEVQAGGHSGMRTALAGESSEGGAWSVAGQRFVDWQRAGGEPASDPAAIARALLGELEATPFGADFAGWRARHADLGCREYLSSGYPNVRPEEDWCYACARQLAGVESQRMFYAHAGARACALEQLELQVRIDAPETARRAHQLAAAELCEQLGEPAPSEESWIALGSSSWRDVLVWSRAGRKVYLFLDGESAGGPVERVGMLVRDRALAERREADAFSELGYPWDVVREQLASALASERPAVAQALRSYGQKPVLARAIAEALDRAPDAGPELQPALLLAADVLATVLPHGAEPSELAAFDLERRGVYFEPTHYGYVLRNHALARRVLDANAAPWADLALVWLHDKLYAGTPTCDADPDQFRNVISATEAALRKRPDSRFRAWLLFDLGRAYETWWSLSRPAPQSHGGSKYAEGADTARKRALDAYRQVSALVPDSPAGRYAADRIPRLALGITTDSRAFYCLSEC